MGRERTSQNTQTTVQQTPEEQARNKLLLGQERQTVPAQTEMQLAGIDLGKALLGGQQLPGFLEGLPGGISEEAIGHQAAELTKKNMANFNSLGLADSGVAFRETSEDIANNLLFPAEQFNIGNLQNLLNLALSGQAQVQSPMVAQQGQMTGNLAGLRGSTSNMTQTNPFLSGQDIVQGVGSGIGAFAALSSDIALKENISLIDTVKDINIYSWDWTEKAKDMGINDPTIGVIAQEIEKIIPDSVIEENGYKKVYYNRVFEYLGGK